MRTISDRLRTSTGMWSRTRGGSSGSGLGAVRLFFCGQCLVGHVVRSCRALRSADRKRRCLRHLARVGRQRDVVPRQLGRQRRIEQAAGQAQRIGGEVAEAQAAAAADRGRHPVADDHRPLHPRQGLHLGERLDHRLGLRRLPLGNLGERQPGRHDDVVPGAAVGAVDRSRPEPCARGTRCRRRRTARRTRATRRLGVRFRPRRQRRRPRRGRAASSASAGGRSAGRRRARP